MNHDEPRPLRRRPVPPIELSEAVDSITVDNLAAAAHVSRQLIYDALNSGELPSFMMGNRRLIRLSSWRSFCEKRETESQTPRSRTTAGSSSRAA